CIGGQVLEIPYDPVFRRYLVVDGYLAQDVGERIRQNCVALNDGLGYEMNTLEFAIYDGTPFAIDYMNPAPDADWWAIGSRYFTWVVSATADLLVGAALNEPRGNRGVWSDMLDGKSQTL
ncbi:MAG: hypothetical protein ACREDR_12865, partial [Blastocatellia bacterium]